jgi:hypothetical protein
LITKSLQLSYKRVLQFGVKRVTIQLQQGSENLAAEIFFLFCLWGVGQASSSGGSPSPPFACHTGGIPLRVQKSPLVSAGFFVPFLLRRKLCRFDGFPRQCGRKFGARGFCIRTADML